MYYRCILTFFVYELYNIFAHIWSEDFWYCYCHIFVLVIFYYSYKCTSHSDSSSIIGTKISSDTIIFDKSGIESTSLVIHHEVCTMSFTIFTLSCHPSIDIQMTIVYITHVTSTANHNLIR